MGTIRIAFRAFGSGRGYGAETYFKTFLHALKQTYGSDVVLYLIEPDYKDSVPEDLKEMVDGIIKIPVFSRWSIRWTVDTIIKLFLPYTVFEASLLKKYDVDIIFGSKIPYKYSDVPIVSWIPDFQHVHFPELFSVTERRNRDMNFMQTARIATRVVLMSEAVKVDFEQFAPMYAHKARILRAVSFIPQSLYDSSPEHIVNRYHLPDKFVYLPNQFWKHKNHELVFQTLQLLNQKEKKVMVVCTGYPVDGRHPDYFSDLLGKISHMGIRDQVIFLGMIPYDHVFQLMRQSVCVLNPSLFEGFGLTVDEARSVGKKLLLSDIPAHREQEPPQAIFFDPLDSNDLAEKLEKVWDETIPGPDETLEIEARQSLPLRIKQSAESFIALVQEVIKE